MGANVKSILIPLILATLCSFGCLVDEDADKTMQGATSDSNQKASGSNFSASQGVYVDLTDSKFSEDGESYSAIGTEKSKILDGTAKIRFDTDDSGNSTGVIKIDLTETTRNTAVYLTGTTSGGVKIQSSTEYETGVYLKNVSITSSISPCIDITKGGAASVFLSGENSLTDGRKYGHGYGDSAASSTQPADANGSDSKGTLYCKGGMAICEADAGGSLSVVQAYKNCVASKDGILAVESGTLTLRNYISDDTKTSSTGKNGLFGGQGIEISGGTIEFNGYGIVTTSDVRKANGFKTDSDDSPSSYVKISGGTVNVATYNGKGICAPIIEIAGGTNSFAVTGTSVGGDDAPGRFIARASTTGTWLDADGIEQSGAVKFAPEGIEGESSITISGGTTIVSAPDDGVNVSNTGGSLEISGGFLYVKAQGDGLDSNGNITISDGVVVVSQTGGGNSPIDCGDNYKFTVTGTGATVFAMGSNDMFSESVPSSTASPMIYSTSLGSSSDSLGVDGIIALKEPQTYEAAILISNELTIDESYSFVKGGTIGGTEYNADAGVYFPATVSGETSVSAKATTQGSTSSGGNGGAGGPSGGGPGGGRMNRGVFGFPPPPPPPPERNGGNEW